MADPVDEGDDARVELTLGLDGADEFAPSPIAMAPDGGPEVPVGAVGMPPKPPDPTPANWICLRGPCRHFFSANSHFEAGNVEGTFDDKDGLKVLDADGKPTDVPLRAPRAYHYFCTAIPGDSIPLQDEILFECNRWDPEDPDDPLVVLRDRRREKYLKANPLFAPLTIDDIPEDAPDAETDPAATFDTSDATPPPTQGDF